MAKKLAQTILEKPMDRRGFLRYMAALLLAFIGVTNVIRALTQHSGHRQKSGYGGGSYKSKKTLT